MLWASWWHKAFRFPTRFRSVSERMQMLLMRQNCNFYSWNLSKWLGWLWHLGNGWETATKWIRKSAFRQSGFYCVWSRSWKRVDERWSHLRWPWVLRANKRPLYLIKGNSPGWCCGIVFMHEQILQPATDSLHRTWRFVLARCECMRLIHDAVIIIPSLCRTDFLWAG